MGRPFFKPTREIVPLEGDYRQQLDFEAAHIDRDKLSYELAHRLEDHTGSTLDKSNEFDTIKEARPAIDRLKECDKVIFVRLIRVKHG